MGCAPVKACFRARLSRENFGKVSTPTVDAPDGAVSGGLERSVRPSPSSTPDTPPAALAVEVAHPLPPVQFLPPSQQLLPAAFAERGARVALRARALSVAASLTLLCLLAAPTAVAGSCPGTGTVWLEAGQGFNITDGPGRYSTYTYCEWTVAPPPGLSIVLLTVQFQTEPLYDFVGVNGMYSDGTNVNWPSPYVLPMGNNLQVFFYSDEYYVDDGFLLIALACKGLQYPSTTTLSCQPCPAGTVTSADRLTCVSSCLPGSRKGDTSCIACEAGTKSRGNTTTCEVCPVGSFSGASSAQCTLCAAGTYQEAEQSSTCPSCPAGTSSLAVGATNRTACEACPPGTFSWSPGLPCTPCPLGTFADHPGAASCSRCPTGTSSCADRTCCEPCPFGTRANVAGRCTPCTAGDFCAVEPPLVVGTTPSFRARHDARMVVLPAGDVLLMGGSSKYFGDYLNDVWVSSDQGHSWELVTPAAEWPPRFSFGAVLIPSTDRVLIMGGTQTVQARDAWWSADGGRTWQLANRTCAWASRSLSAVVALPARGEVLMMGGQTTTSSPEVWVTADPYGGVWTLRTDTPAWAGRTNPAAGVLPTGEVILMGGMVRGTYMADVWSSADGGTAWQLLTSMPGWSVRWGPTCVVLPWGEVLIMGGTMVSTLLTDVWSSEDGGRTWAKVTDYAEWSVRTAHAVAVLPSGTVLTAGGFMGTEVQSAVWASHDGGRSWRRPEARAAWQQRTAFAATTLPSGRVLLLGGKTNGSPNPSFRDTWSSADQGRTWVELNEAAEWSARDGLCAVLLHKQRAVLMTGGARGTAATNDVWASQDGRAWQQVTAAAPWPVRYGHACAALPSGEAVVMAGRAGQQFRGDVWASPDGGVSWEMRVFTAPWGLRSDHAAVALPSGSLLLLGGLKREASEVPTRDVWTSADGGRSWEALTAQAPWAARYGHCALTVPGTGQVLLLGGTGGASIFNDVWASDDGGRSWATLAAAASWSGRYHFGAVLAPGGALLVLGGRAATGDRADTWRSLDGGRSWTELTSGSYPARTEHAAVVLGGGEVLTMGGRRLGARLQDVWMTVDEGSSWTVRTAVAQWTTRYHHTVVYVRPLDEVLLMGGFDGSLAGDVWASRDQGRTWELRSSSPGWVTRIGHTTVALASGEVLLLGGNQQPFRKNDVWSSVDGGRSWVQVAATAAWIARESHCSVVLASGEVLVMGGSDTAFVSRNDVWASPNAGRRWERLTANAGWRGRMYFACAATQSGEVLVVGGTDASFARLNDVWSSSDGGRTWSQRAVAAAWAARQNPVLAALQSGAVLLVGGDRLGTELDDAWLSEDGGYTWKQRNIAPSRSGGVVVQLGAATTSAVGLIGGSQPGQRDAVGVVIGGHTMVTHSAEAFQHAERACSVQDALGRTLVLGGRRQGVVVDELVLLPPASMYPVATRSTGIERYDHRCVMTGDSALLAAGGRDDTGALLTGVLASLDFGETWELRASLPFAREGFSLAGQGYGGAVALAGASVPFALHNDVWALRANGSWQLVLAAAPWAPRFNALAFSRPDGVVCIAGGLADYATPLQDMWCSTNWTCEAWVRVARPTNSTLYAAGAFMTPRFLARTARLAVPGFGPGGATGVVTVHQRRGVLRPALGQVVHRGEAFVVEWALDRVATWRIVAASGQVLAERQHVTSPLTWQVDASWPVAHSSGLTVHVTYYDADDATDVSGPFSIVDAITLSSSCDTCDPAAPVVLTVGVVGPTTMVDIELYRSPIDRQPWVTAVAAPGSVVLSLPLAIRVGTARWRVVSTSQPLSQADLALTIACAAGWYALDGLCTPCPLHTFSPAPGATACLSCPPETRTVAVASNASTACLACGPGHYAGLHACLPCPKGSHQPSWNATSVGACRPCPAGTFSDAIAREQCTPCLVGTYSTVAGAVTSAECRACPLAHATTRWAGSASNTSCGCQPAFVLDDRHQTSQCTPCPDGLDCTTIGTVLSAAQAQPGFWRTGPASLTLYECKPRQACNASAIIVGGGGVTVACRDGHIGPRCEVCKDGWFVDRGLCKPCSSGQVLGALLPAALLLVGFVLLVGWLTCARSTDVDEEMPVAPMPLPAGQHSAVEMGVLTPTTPSGVRTPGPVSRVRPGPTTPIDTPPKSRFSASHIAKRARSSARTLTKVKLAISFLQIATTSTTVMDLVWSEPTHTMMSALRVVNLDLDMLRWSCLVASWNYMHSLVVLTLVPLGLVALVALLYLGALALRGRRVGSAGRRHAWTTALMVLFLSYPLVSTRLFLYFKCESFDDGSRFLTSDLTISCNSAAYHGFTSYVVVMILVYVVGVPLLFSTLLLTNYRAVRQPDAPSQAEAVARRQLEPSIAHLSFLFASYSPRWFMTEVLELLRKMLLTGFLVLFAPAREGNARGSVQCMLAMFVIVAYVLLYSLTRPMLVETNNTVLVGSVALLFVVFLLALASENTLIKDEVASRIGSNVLDWAMVVTIIAVLALAVGALLADIVLALRKRSKLRVYGAKSTDTAAIGVLGAGQAQSQPEQRLGSGNLPA